jgi:LPXTG-motif cell wall-anchored protein
VRIRFALALMVAGILCAAGVASAQQTTTEPLSDYTSTTPTTTVEKTTTQGTTTQAPATQGQSQSSVAPTVAAQPAGSAPSSLAFTGAEPLLLIIAGLALAGGTATLLVRDRRRSEDR